MGAAIYILKILICSEEFPLSATQQVDILMMSSYLIYVHFPNWFKCGKMADAPALTPQLHHDLEAWVSRDPEGARAALRKLDLHTDYLNGRSVVYAFASNRVSDDTKEAMAKKLLATEPVDIDISKPALPRVYSDSTLSDFIDGDSWLFFKLCKLEPTFLAKPAAEWASDDSYKLFCSLVDGFFPVNDAGERAVKFASDFNGKITLDPVQHQGMLQGIEKHRRNHPKATKSNYKSGC